MINKNTYIYLSGHQSNWLRLYVFATLAMLVLLYVFGLPLWFSPIVSTFTLGVIYIINLGKIKISRTQQQVSILDLHHRLELHAPLEMRTWWHYIYRGENYATDVHVILHVKDSKGNDLYFSETIMFDTRHPNNVTFREEHIPDGATVVRVQRVDKLQRFLESTNG